MGFRGLQHPSIRECILNHTRDPTTCYGVFLKLRDIGVSGFGRFSRVLRTFTRGVSTGQSLALGRTNRFRV